MFETIGSIIVLVGMLFAGVGVVDLLEIHARRKTK